MMAPMAGPLAAVVLEGHAGPVRVLDIAAGHGLFGIEIAKQNPQARVTAWTGRRCCAWPGKRAEGRSARPLPDAPRQRLRGGLRRPLRCRAAHQFPAPLRPPTCVGLLKKVHAALTARRARRHARIRAQRRPRLAPHARGLQHDHADSTPAGDAYTLSELTAMYTEAGFSGITAHPIPMSPHTVVMGRA